MKGKFRGKYSPKGFKEEKALNGAKPNMKMKISNDQRIEKKNNQRYLKRKNSEEQNLQLGELLKYFTYICVCVYVLKFD